MLKLESLAQGAGYWDGLPLAVVYVGRYYLIFREKRQIEALTRHFDHLVREADVDARSVGDRIEVLAGGVWE